METVSYICSSITTLSTQDSWSTTVDTRGIADCFEECDVEGGWKSVELYVTDAVKKDVDFDWIRSAGRSFHC
jgi:hypothetical protein